MTVRVSVTDVWDTVRLDVTPDWTVSRLKDEALRRAKGWQPDGARYLVKFRGAAIFDESTTLSQLQVPDEAALIVLPAKRQPVR